MITTPPPDLPPFRASLGARAMDRGAGTRGERRLSPGGAPSFACPESFWRMAVIIYNAHEPENIPPEVWQAMQEAAMEGDYIFQMGCLDNYAILYGDLAGCGLCELHAQGRGLAVVTEGLRVLRSLTGTLQ